jgi:hypothetical protein
MEDGRRLENMSWRLWNRETLCCAPDYTTTSSSRWNFTRRASDASSVPKLSSSVDSQSSDDSQANSAAQSRKSTSRPELRSHDSTDSRGRAKGKHITPIDLEKIVISIKEKKDLEPLSPLPQPFSLQTEPKEVPVARIEDTTPRPESPPPQIAVDSSTSTVATTVLDSEASTNMSPPVGSDASTSTELSSHSVVRGFALGRVSSSFRSNTQLASSPVSKPTAVVGPRLDAPKKKTPMFTLGSDSDEGNESSFDSHMRQRSPQIQSSLSEALRKPQALEKKRAQYLNGSSALAARSDEDNSSSAIEDTDESAVEDDEDEWCSDEEEDDGAVGSEQVSFPRIDSRPNLTSRRSLITTALTERDRAEAMQKQASRSTTALRRSRTSSPNGPSLGTSPREGRELQLGGIQIPSRPVIMTTSNTHPPATSPRTTRRNMLSTELTESLRKHLLWERQQKNATSNALLKRRHTSNDVKNLRHYPEPPAATLAPIRESSRNNNSWNAYFDHGLQEYHVKGW